MTLMKNPKLYYELTGETLEIVDNIKHEIICYVDDTQHVVSANSHDEVTKYLNQLHKLLHAFYTHNSLVINSSKTEYMYLDKNINEDDHLITDSTGKNI